MSQSDDDATTEATESAISISEFDDEPELAGRAGAGDQEAFDLLYDRYFPRISKHFATLGAKQAEAAVQEVLTELFGSLTKPSDLSLSERAYRLALATKLRHTSGPERAPTKHASPAKAHNATSETAKDLPPRVRL